MRAGRAAHVLAGACLLASVAAAQAQPLVPVLPGGYKGDFEEDRPWEEQKAALPPYPVPSNLVRIYVSAPTSFEFLVDTASVSVGKDGVVRYTMVARSQTGAMNLSYEGLRCRTRERKLYAFGRPDGTWSQARSASWVAITGSQPNRQHATLAEDFFCQGSATALTAEEAVRALRRGGHPASSHSADMRTQPR